MGLQFQADDDAFVPGQCLDLEPVLAEHGEHGADRGLDELRIDPPQDQIIAVRRLGGGDGVPVSRCPPRPAGSPTDLVGGCAPFIRLAGRLGGGFALDLADGGLHLGAEDDPDAFGVEAAGVGGELGLLMARPRERPQGGDVVTGPLREHRGFLGRGPVLRGPALADQLGEAAVDRLGEHQPHDVDLLGQLDHLHWFVVGLLRRRGRECQGGEAER